MDELMIRGSVYCQAADHHAAGCIWTLYVEFICGIGSDIRDGIGFHHAALQGLIG